MFRKLSSLEVPEDEPFRNCKLGRKDVAENLTALIQSASEPFVLSLNSQWGDGKTEFIRMWRQHLINLGHSCVYYDAWKNDFSEDPLFSFIGAIRFDLEKSVPPTKAQKVIELALGMAKQAVPIAVKLVTSSLIDLSTIEIPEFKEGLEKAFSEYSRKKMDEYLKYQESLIGFKDYLSKLVVEVTSQPGKKGPLIIFIDELDRCKPTFAINLLEIIKHFFSVPNIVYILAIDRKHLSQMVKTRYGLGMDTDGYLRRFIDYQYSLPELDQIGFTEFLLNKFNLDEYLPKNDITDIKEIFPRLASLFGFSLRKQGQCFTQLNLVARMSEDKLHIYSGYLTLLIFLKSENSQIYYQLNSRSIEFSKIVDLFYKKNPNSNLFKTGVWIAILGYLYIHLTPQSRQSVLRLKAGSGNIVMDLPKPFQELNNKVEEWIKDNIRDEFFMTNAHDAVYRRIEMTGNFDNI